MELDHAHAPRVGRAQAERVAGDLRDARVQSPGARLELQLPVLDVELARASALGLQRGERLARLVLRGDEPERAGEENEEEEKVQLRHASGSVRANDDGSNGAAV